jgi:hypothetical protein
MTLHLSQIGLTLGLTFTVLPFFRSNGTHFQQHREQQPSGPNDRQYWATKSSVLRAGAAPTPVNHNGSSGAFEMPYL